MVSFAPILRNLILAAKLFTPLIYIDLIYWKNARIFPWVFTFSRAPNCFIICSSV